MMERPFLDLLLQLMYIKQSDTTFLLFISQHAIQQLDIDCS